MSHPPLAKPEEIGLDPHRLQHAYALLEKRTADGSIPGGAIAVGRRGRLVEPRYFGRQGPEADAPPIRRDGMFLLASLTKPIVYLGAMMLVERGLLSLSRRVTDYLPDFAAHHKETTLVQQLFTHTSGLPDMLKNNHDLRREHAPLEKFIDGAIREAVPLFPPGSLRRNSWIVRPLSFCTSSATTSVPHALIAYYRSLSAPPSTASARSWRRRTGICWRTWSMR